MKGRPKSKWERWLPYDCTIQMLEAFQGLSDEQMQLNYEIRLASAGFGKRYRKTAWNVRLTKAWVEAYRKSNPDVPDYVLMAQVMLSRPNGRECLRQAMRHAVEGLLQ